VQQKETTNPAALTDVFELPATGRVLAIDPGTKRCGVAICDEMRVTTRPLPVIHRTSWKKLLSNIKEIVTEFDAAALVIGLPLESDGTESKMSVEARRMARNFSLSLDIPVFLQDERATSYEAKGNLWKQGRTLKQARGLVDSEAAAIILSDFLAQHSRSRLTRQQSTNNILLVRPSRFAFNSETASSNAFQTREGESAHETQAKALSEFESFAASLRSAGVNVFVSEDTETPEKPDAVFPNNWVTFHEDGTVILYPMFARSRRSERRRDIIDSLRKHFKASNVIDLSDYENENKFLEGTGSIVFDHKSGIAYASLSARTDRKLFLRVCDYLHYKPVYFNTHDKNGQEIYHTNVMMCIGDRFSVVCLESITAKDEREAVRNSLAESGHQILEITFEQMNDFAGNMLSLKTNDRRDILALSRRAFDSFTAEQIQSIEAYCEMVPLEVSTIETAGGGSARCMIAEIFLQPIGS